MEEIELKENYFHLSMCSGFTEDVIDELRLTLNKVQTLNRIVKKVPFWRKKKKHIAKIYNIVQDVVSRERCALNT